MAIYFSKMQTDPSPQQRLIADLHIHSTASDGEYTPAQIADMLTRRNISVAALADHDTIDGFKEFREHFSGLAIPGVELSVNYRGNGFHLLSYGFDPDDRELNRGLKYYRQVRLERIKKMLLRLDELGAPVELPETLMQRENVTLGRPHLARALMSAGHVKNFQEAFNRFIGDGKPAYISKVRMDFEEALRITGSAGGIAVLAHPGLYQGDISFNEMIKIPVNGFEVYHPNHSKSYTRILCDHCIRNGIPYSGGSDFHDLRKNKVNVLGSYGLLAHEWDNFSAYLKANCAYTFSAS